MQNIHLKAIIAVLSYYFISLFRTLFVWLIFFFFFFLLPPLIM